MRIDARVALFDLGAAGYDLLVRQDLWRAQIARVLDHVPRPWDHLRVLDLGCGPGVSAFVLAERLGRGATLTGIDFAAGMIERANRRLREHDPPLANVRFEQADATDLPFEDSSFDLAVGHSFLYLVREPDRVLREVRRVLAASGRLVLLEPLESGNLWRALVNAAPALPGAMNAPWQTARFALSMFLWRQVSARAGRMSPARIERLFRTAGFEDVATHPTLSGLALHCVGRRPEDAAPQMPRGVPSAIF